LLTLALSFLAFLGIGVPIAVVLGAASLVFLLVYTDLDFIILPSEIFHSLDVFLLTSIPFFILAGRLMNEGGITQRLVRFSRLIVGNVRGSLAQVNVVTSMFFGGITGSAVADTSAVGSVLIPAMKQDGYEPSFAAAVTASSSTMGPIIPPSIPMLVYAFVSGASVGALFLAGVIPGLLIGFTMIALNMFLVRRRGVHDVERGAFTFTREEKWAAFRDGLLALVMPVIIVGGIVFGITTPTEAAAIAAFYALLIGTFIFREIQFARMPQVLLDTSITSAVVLLIIATSKILAFVFAYEQIPDQVAEFITSMTTTWWIFLIIVIVLLLLVGMLLEPSGAIIVLVPVLLPAAKAMGIDPVHFGTVIVFGLVIGLLTPPVGLCLFVACSISGLRLDQITRACLPYLLQLIIVLFAVAFIPALSLLLPRLAGY
jgi:C4-dicarboxylate transporter DctM subunit